MKISRCDEKRGIIKKLRERSSCNRAGLTLLPVEN